MTPRMPPPSSPSSFRGPSLSFLFVTDRCFPSSVEPDHSFVGLMIGARRPPNCLIRTAKSDVPPGPSPVGFSSQHSTAHMFFGSSASTRAVLIIQRLVREKTDFPFGGDLR